MNGDRAALHVNGTLASWASTEHAVRQFCVNCGSTLFLFERDEPDVVEIATGTIDEPRGILSTRISRAYADRFPDWAKPSGVEP